MILYPVQSYKVWLKSAEGLWRRCCLIFFTSVALVIILCTEVERFVQFLQETSLGTILSSLVEIHQVVTEEMSFDFLFYVWTGLHFVQWGGTIEAILVRVEDLQRNNPSFVEICQVVIEEK